MIRIAKIIAATNDDPRITALESENAALKERVAELETEVARMVEPMFWEDCDEDTAVHDTLDDAIDEVVGYSDNAWEIYEIEINHNGWERSKHFIAWNRVNAQGWDSQSYYIEDTGPDALKRAHAMIAEQRAEFASDDTINQKESER